MPSRNRIRAVTVTLVGLMALAALISVVAPTGADDGTRVAARSPGNASLGGRVPRPAAPAELVALTGERVVVLDSRTGAERRVLASYRSGRDDTVVTLQGVAVTPDGRHVYYAVVTPDDGGTIYRAAADGRSSPEVVGRGISPAVSPDGRLLAFAAPGPGGPDGLDRCCNTIAVRGLTTGALRIWGFPASDVPDWVDDASFTKLAWAPDARRLAFTMSYEGDTVSVLDTVVHPDLSEMIEVVVPGGGGDSGQPTWQAGSGRLAVVNQAFSCCFEDTYTGPSRTLLVDVARHQADELLMPGRAPTWLDFDATGEHLLFVEGGRLYRRSHEGPAVELAQGISAADW